VERALRQRTDARREAFVLLRFEGMSVADAAEVLGISDNAVKLRAFQAYESIREAATRLEQLWRLVSEGHEPDDDIMMAMENAAGSLVGSMSDGDGGQLSDLTERLVGGIEASKSQAEPVPLRRPEPGSLGGLLSSVSESLLGGATRVDTGDLYRLINRIVEVALDTEALADLALVSIEGSDPAVFRRSWRGQLEKLSASIGDIQDQAVALANVSFRDAASTFPQFVRYLGRRMGKDVRFEILGDDVQLDRQIVDLLREPLRHLLVNAIDHGIEGAADRIAAGKTATGVVTSRHERLMKGSRSRCPMTAPGSTGTRLPRSRCKTTFRSISPHSYSSRASPPTRVSPISRGVGRGWLPRETPWNGSMVPFESNR
jgi:chemotaxis protein histidine kinase CheA